VLPTSTNLCALGALMKPRHPSLHKSLVHLDVLHIKAYVHEELQRSVAYKLGNEFLSVWSKLHKVLSARRELEHVRPQPVSKLHIDGLTDFFLRVPSQHILHYRVGDVEDAVHAVSE